MIRYQTQKQLEAQYKFTTKEQSPHHIEHMENGYRKESYTFHGKGLVWLLSPDGQPLLCKVYDITGHILELWSERSAQE